jgi:transcriptional regulator with XRE-family HTH domain
MSEDEYNIKYHKLIHNIGRNVRRLRGLRGLSQEKLAFKADIDRSYIGYIENGKHNLSLKKILQISIALDVEIEDIIKDVTE